MTILFMGGEMDAFVANSSGVTETTPSGQEQYNSGFARCAITPSTVAEYCEAQISAGQTDVWLHFDVISGGFGNASAKRMSWLDGSGTEMVRVLQDEITKLLELDYYNGSAWVSVGSVACSMILGSSRQTIDIHAVVNSASGSLKLYIAGTKLIDSGTIDLSGITALKNARFFGTTSTQGFDVAYFSQVVMADEPTVGMRLLTRYPNGAGATSSWTGAYTDIDEAVYEDADFILSGVANQVSTFSQTGSSTTGYSVRAVCVSARAKCGVGGPQNLQLALRSASTDYFSGSKLLDVGYANYQNIWETDPATSAAWVNTAITSLQPGVKSIA